MLSSSLGTIVRETSNFLVEEKVLAAAADSISFNGLDGLADGGYRLELGLVPTKASYVGIIINGDTTLGNYLSEVMLSSGTNIASMAFTPSNSVLFVGQAGSLVSVIADFILAGNQVIVTSICRSIWTSERLLFAGLRYTPTINNLNSITLQGYTDGTNTQLSGCFGAGTIVRLYRKRQGLPSAFPSSQGMLVSDILVPSNTTSVLLTGLDLSLHGGYEFDFRLAGNTNICGYAIRFNDDITATHYRTSYNLGVQSNSSRNLLNTTWSWGASIFGYMSSAKHCYFNIVPESSSYSPMLTTMSLYGVSGNITSLQLDSSIAGGILAGSRFRLYRRK